MRTGENRAKMRESVRTEQIGEEKEAKALETYQIALIIVLVGCVAALFYIWFKNRQGSTEQPAQEPIQPEKPEIYSIPDPVAYVPEAEEIVSDQHTIYAFEREVQVYVCPRCDGENSVNRQSCCICGFTFRKGVFEV